MCRCALDVKKQQQSESALTSVHHVQTPSRRVGHISRMMHHHFLTAYLPHCRFDYVPATNWHWCVATLSFRAATYLLTLCVLQPLVDFVRNAMGNGKSIVSCTY